jgi:hypothetical protein
VAVQLLTADYLFLLGIAAPRSAAQAIIVPMKEPAGLHSDTPTATTAIFRWRGANGLLRSPRRNPAGSDRGQVLDRAPDDSAMLAAQAVGRRNAADAAASCAERRGRGGLGGCSRPVSGSFRAAPAPALWYAAQNGFDNDGTNTVMVCSPSGWGRTRKERLHPCDCLDSRRPTSCGLWGGAPTVAATAVRGLLGAISS